MYAIDIIKGGVNPRQPVDQDLSVSPNINALRATDSYLYKYYMLFRSKYQQIVIIFLFPNVPYPSRNPESHFKYRYPTKYIHDHMLLDQQGRSKNAQRHQDRNDFVGAV